MEENGFQFRTAAFGGFQKQDVMEYLEQSAQEHTRKVAELQRELEEKKRTQAAAEERYAGLEKRLSALEAENQRLAADLADREDRLNQTMAEKDELRAEVTRLSGEVERLKPSAAAYETVKDRTAGIELEAHGRAQAIEREGRAKALKYQEQVKEWFLKTREAYDRLRADLNVAMSRTVQELDRAGRSIGELTGGLEYQDTALKAIEAQIEALDGAKPPIPLTLNEETDGPKSVGF